MTIRGRDFEALAKLANDDPTAFEALRRQAIEELIEAAPERMRKRLQGLQWQIDMEREQSGSSMGACVKLSQMMWESVTGPGGLVEAMAKLANTGSDKGVELAHAEPSRNAKVVELHSHRGGNKLE